MSATARSDRLAPPVDPAHDHVLGEADAAITLVEYGSYACEHCHAAHEVVSNLRDRFGSRMRYVYRHLPLTDRDQAKAAAEIAEYAAATGGEFWPAHDTLMHDGPMFSDADLETVAEKLGVPPRDERDETIDRAVVARVRADARSGIESGARVTPTFYINGRRYDGAWDEASLSEAMLGSLGHRLHTASVNFAQWGPSTGLLLLVMSLIAIVISNTAAEPAFAELWHTPLGIRIGEAGYSLPVVDWVNDGLLTIFFLVVGLEIKREFTIGRLATRRAAALPLLAALGGMTVPALIYLSIIPPGPLAAGWGMTIATDTAFAVALIVLLGERVPVDLRVFLTAAVIVDDLVAIAVVALFYSDGIDVRFIAAAIAATGLLLALNKWEVYRPLPYAIVGIALWIFLHEGGLHATLAGVILAIVTPTRPPPNLAALMSQAQAVIQAETKQGADRVRHVGPSEPALRALDAIHDRIESPASKLLRTVEPWSSYFVLPVFALANAGVAWSAGILDGNGRLMLAIVLGLVVGKPVGIVVAARIAVRLGVAVKPATYTWRQLAGASAIAGIGFTMSLFIAGQAFDAPTDFAAAKIAIFAASILAGATGAVILSVRRSAATQGE